MIGRSLLVVPLALSLAASVATSQTDLVVNPIGMEFVRIEPGTMLVGRFQPTCPSPDAEADAEPRTGWTAEDYRDCEEIVRRQSTPGFPVTIAEPFYLGRYEVTQDQWVRVMGHNPSFFQGERLEGDAGGHPVESVTWDQAVSFAERLSEMDAEADYRLPTEFEWEYAARAGADQEPSWELIRESAWIALANKGTTHPVGGKEPNPWGLYDTLGNVWEWVADHYNGETFPDADPPSSGTTHVLRGGSFLSDVKNATWFTHAGGPGNGFDIGFRLVREDR